MTVLLMPDDRTDAVKSGTVSIILLLSFLWPSFVRVYVLHRDQHRFSVTKVQNNCKFVKKTLSLRNNLPAEQLTI